MLQRINLFVASLLFLTGQSFTSSAAETKPLRALLITGGCCHNYPLQTQQLTNAMTKLAAVDWTVVMDGGNGTRAEISLYDNPDWAKGYDVVIHNECFADTTNQVYLRKITTAHHAGVPAVVIHCAMHTYRSVEIDDWREFLGVTSKRHDHPQRHRARLGHAHGRALHRRKALAERQGTGEFRERKGWQNLPRGVDQSIRQGPRLRHDVWPLRRRVAR
jgi:hypothetical protein